MAKQRRIHTNEFKVQAIKMVTEQGLSYAEAARRLGISANLLSRWKKQLDMHCYDNAPMESFWSSLKKELVYPEPFATIAEAEAKVFEHIEVFYNRERRHSSLGYRSPAEFESNNHS